MATRIQHIDCIIIGAGGAGYRAAIELTLKGVNVSVFCHGFRSETKTYAAQGGIQASFGLNDTEAMHASDTLKAGNFKSKPSLVNILASKAKETVNWLSDTIGAEFLKNDGEYILSNAGGLSKPRIISSLSNAGISITKPLWQYVDTLGIETRENYLVTNIDKCENGFHVKVRNFNDELYFIASTIILATGGFSSAMKNAGKGQQAKIPTGIDLVKDLGVNVVQPELTQMHPTGVLWPSELRRLRLPETMRGNGAILKNRLYNPFVNGLLTRSEVTEAIYKEVKSGLGVSTKDGNIGVYLDTTIIKEQHNEDFLLNNYESIYTEFKKFDHDLNTKPVIVYPILHYSLGGVEIDEKCRTGCAGLFAAGEVTWGVHGEDRLMGNSLLDIFVFGKIAGLSVIEYLGIN